MNQKINCKKCNLLIDDDMKYCPYCGTVQDEQEDQVLESKKEGETVQKSPVVTQTITEEKKSVKFFDFPSRAVNVNIVKSIVFFIIGLIGLNLLGYLYVAIINALDNKYFQTVINANAAINFSLYLLLFGVMLIILNSDFIKLFSGLNKLNKWLQSLAFGVLLLIVQSTVSIIMQTIVPTGINNNEAGIESITTLYPLLSILVFGFVGPFVEEVTYRVGLFTLLRKWNRVLAYVGTAIIFGLIHFDFGASDIVTEFVNLPTYLASGLLLCYFYEYAGFEASFIAHATNNLVATIISLTMIVTHS